MLAMVVEVDEKRRRGGEEQQRLTSSHMPVQAPFRYKTTPLPTRWERVREISGGEGREKKIRGCTVKTRKEKKNLESTASIPSPELQEVLLIIHYQLDFPLANLVDMTTSCPHGDVSSTSVGSPPPAEHAFNREPETKQGRRAFHVCKYPRVVDP